MAVQVIADGGPDGTKIGNASTYLIGFYGATPVVRQTLATAPSATVAVTSTATNWGYSTSTQADAIVTCLRAIQTTLTNLGLHA